LFQNISDIVWKNLVQAINQNELGTRDHKEPELHRKHLPLRWKLTRFTFSLAH